MRDVKVSVIVPAYNAEAYIETCLECLLQQTYSNMEIVVVNDGSKDKTAKILDEYSLLNRRIKVIHKENGGVTSARIRGVEESTGEYIGFIDADDYVDPIMFQKLVENAIKYDADISHCGYIMVFPNGRKDYYYDTKNIRVQNNVKGLVDLLEGKIIEPSLGNKLFKKRLFDELLQSRQMDLSIKNNEDVLMNYYLFKESKKSVFEDICLYHYLVRKESAANAAINKNQLCDPIKVTKIILNDIYKNNLFSLVNLGESRLLHQLVNLVTLDYKEDKSLCIPIQKEAYKELKEKTLSVLMNSEISKKLKLKVVLANASPQLYRGLHKIYVSISGNDKKYSLEE